MLRALGMQKERLISLIGLQSGFFSLPGLCAGIIVALVLNVGARFAIFTLSFNSMGYGLTMTSIVLALGFGILVPFLANIMPTLTALNKELRSSLDLNHRSQNGLSVTSQRLDDMVGLSTT